MRKIILGIYGVIGIAIIIVLMSFIIENKNQPLENNYNNEIVNGEVGDVVIVDEHHDDPVEEERYISKALVAKLICLSKESKLSIEQRELEYINEDQQGINWYDKYINVALIEGWFLNDDVLYQVDENLKYSELLHILSYFNAGHLEITKDYSEDEDVRYDDFMICLNYLLTLYDEATSPSIKNLYIFSINSDYVATDFGKFSCEGLDLLSLQDKKISALVRGNEILTVEDVFVEAPVLTGAYIKNYDPDTRMVDIFMGGDTRSLEVDEYITIKDIESEIADVQIQNDRVIYVNQIDTMVAGIVKKISTTDIEFEGLGDLEIREDCKIYNTINDVAFTNIYDVLVGYSTALHYVDEENRIVAIEVVKKPDIEAVRVAINDTNFNSLYHEEVIISCNGAFGYTYNEDTRLLNAGSVLDITELGMKDGERVVITSDTDRLQILTIYRGWGSNQFNPLYRGSIEIEKTENGYVIVNEVDLEEYLYGVVPSEMPVSYGLEALKVQSICARSYAYIQFYSNSYCEYGAHVDDSTMSQVYNNTSEDQTAISAVRATDSMLLSYNNNIVSTNFFSTSCGVTSNVGEVWANYSTKEFPTTSVSYLQSKYQSDSGVLAYELSSEEGFRGFIDDHEMVTFDSAYSWYRWDVSMTTDEIEASIKSAINDRIMATPRLIKTKTFDGSYKSREISDVGELIDLNIITRGGSGIITELLIITTTGEYLIQSEYNIRKLLAPIDTTNNSITINRADGSKVSTMALMPSAYFYMDRTYDGNGSLLSINFVGGGYGHGVGMSQNGVKTMVDLGYSYKEILFHYYDGTEIVTR